MLLRLLIKKFFLQKVPYIIFLLFIYGNSIHSQYKKNENIDSLSNKTFEELNILFRKNYEDTLKCRIYLNAILTKAIKEKEYHHQARTYCNLSYYEKEDSKKILLIDKSIQIGTKLNDKSYLLLPYSFKGSFFYHKRNYSKALKNYLKVLEIAESVKSSNYIDIAKHNIGLLKTEIGKHDEALPLLRKSFYYEKNRPKLDTASYLESLLSLAKSYRYNGILDSATFYNREGIRKSKKSYLRTYYPFIFNEGANLYFKNNLKGSWDSINKALAISDINNPQYKDIFILGEFYKGKIREKYNHHDQALRHYLIMDSLIQVNHLFTAEVREGYEFIIKSFKKGNNKDKQLEYINKLLYLDSVIYSQRNFVSDKLFSEFDKPKLIKEKEKIINTLKTNNEGTYNLLWGFIFFSVLTSSLLFFQYKKRKLLKLKFDQILEKSSLPIKNNSEKIITENIKEIGIPQHIIESVLLKLEKFERSQNYLNKGININTVSKNLGTNSKYLSKIINTHRKKSFTKYINDLRIDYLVKELKQK